jgi:phenylacetate-CoA ligase
MALELSVVVPCLNEEFNVDELARRVLGVFDVGGFSGELILVDDGSADGTRAAIEALATRFPGLVVGRFHAQNAGIAAAWRTGTAAARGRLVSIIDADLQYQPEDLLRMRRELIEHTLDIVQGWRSPVGRKKETRYYLSRGLNALLNATFGMRLRDNKSGFVVCAKEVMEDLLTYKASYHYWQSFIMVAAHAKGYSYKEIEILFENRRQGQSFLEKTAYRAVARSFVDLPKAVWEYRLARRAHDIGDQFVRRYPVRDRSKPHTPTRELHWKAYMTTFERTHWMLTRDVERYYDTLRKTQWLTPPEMRELQDEKLRRLVRHGYRHVPYYRGRMQDLKLRPEDIRGQGDLHKLPFLTKADVRKHLYFDILSENHSKRDVLQVATSGSTGEPFIVYADRAQLEFRWAATLRSQEWTGYEFGDRCVRLWHQTLGMDKTQIVKEKLDAAFTRRKFIPVFEMSEDKLEAMAREIAEWNPVLMDGYAEALDFLAHYLKSRSDLPVRPKALMSSAQTLPESSRKLIEEAFGCRVFDKYGAREFSGIAYECEAHKGHHVVGEGFIVEILRDGMPVKPGEMGEIVITDLNNYCLPFIRYRLGDLGVAVDPNFACPCGRGLPLVGNIEGRVQSIIQGTRGQFLPGSFFAHYLKEFDHAIQRFQVVQEREGAITFQVVRGGRFSDDVLEEVLATFRQHLGDDMAIEVQFVDNIEMVRTGKRLASVSRLKVDFQKGAPEQAAVGLRSGRS